MVAHQYCGSRTPVPVCNVSVSQQTGSTSNSVHVSVTQLAFRGQELLESSRPTAQKHLQFRCYCSHTPVHVYTASVLQLAVSAEHDVLQFATHILQLAVNAEHDVLQFATQLAVSAEHDVLQIATHILQLVSVLQVFLSRQEILEHQ